MVRTKVLLLAGTTEASALARRLAARADVEVLASLAGRTRAPAALGCPTRVGGFGGVAGLVAHLRAERTDLLVDATHPFAAQMPHHAAAAASAVGAPRLRVLRPPWSPEPGDRWHHVANLAAAAACLADLGARRVLLTTGRQELVPFASLAGVHLVVRAIDPPVAVPLADATVVLDRGPFTVAGELALLREHGIDAVVTKNSGGTATAAKLVAARQLALPVVVVDRPPTPAGPTVATVDEAERWVAQHVRG